ncbi:MAG: hypothetical protein AB9866_01685 [Syntrophobacteraceae bacterium]
MYEASSKADLNLPLAVSSFPAQTPEEERWKNKMLLGLLLVSGEAHKTIEGLQIPPQFLSFLYEEVYSRCKEFLILKNGPGSSEEASELKTSIIELYRLLRRKCRPGS